MLGNRDEICLLIKHKMKRYDCCPQWVYRGEEQISKQTKQLKV